MTPDKVEEIVEQMFDTEYIGGKQPNLNKEWLRDALTQYHQDLMSEVVGKENEIKRLRSALDWIAIVANEKSPHLGRPRSSDTSCVFCMAYLALNDGAYGEHIDYESLSSAKRQEWSEKKNTEPQTIIKLSK